MTEFENILALMGVADYIYHGKKSNSFYKWATKRERLAYNIGWEYAKKNIE